MFWRFDVIPVAPFSILAARGGQSEEPFIRDLPLNKFNRSDYPEQARQAPIIYLEDNVLSVPGWAASCLLYSLAQAHNPGTTVDYYTTGGEWRAEIVFNHPKQERGTVNWAGPDAAVYRGPLVHVYYARGAMKMCKLLEGRFGGPSCKLNDLASLPLGRVYKRVPLYRPFSVAINKNYYRRIYIYIYIYI